MSELIRCGCDLLEIRRLDQARDRLLVRLFDPEELALCGGRPASLAAFYAAKEAFAKALACGLMCANGLAFRDVAIRKTPQGAPYYVWGLKVENLVASLSFPESGQDLLSSSAPAPCSSSNSSPSFSPSPRSSLSPSSSSSPSCSSNSSSRPSSHLHLNSGPPEVSLRYRLKSASLSLSHEGGLALAFAVLTLQARPALPGGGQDA